MREAKGRLPAYALLGKRNGVPTICVLRVAGHPSLLLKGTLTFDVSNKLGIRGEKPDYTQHDNWYLTGMPISYSSMILGGGRLKGKNLR